MRIIPAIDIIDGKCVRLQKGDFATEKIYSEDPVKVAQEFEDAGIKYLHFINLDGAGCGKIYNHRILEKIATKTNLIIDYGGGIQSEKSIKTVLNAGATQVTLGSLAVQNPEKAKELLRKYGSDKIILGADCRNRRISTNAWLKDSQWEVIDFIKEFVIEGLKYTIVTDIEKDGMLNGPSPELYKDILKETDVYLIASGGITNINDVKMLAKLGCEAVIIGKAIYEGTIKLKELTKL